MMMVVRMMRVAEVGEAAGATAATAWICQMRSDGSCDARAGAKRQERGPRQGQEGARKVPGRCRREAALHIIISFISIISIIISPPTKGRGV